MHYVTDATHFLDEKCAIGPKEGAARQMAEFFGDVIAHATVSSPQEHLAHCCKCSEKVDPVVVLNGDIDWACSECNATGRISNWQGTFWDLSVQSLDSFDNSNKRAD